MPVAVDIITNLKGFFKEYAVTDLEEKPVDVIKAHRENYS
jgi:hypothetical protein